MNMYTLIEQTKLWAKNFLREERGDFGIGQIAGIVAAVVIVGVIVSTITGLLPNWIGEIWTMITGLFDRIGT